MGAIHCGKCLHASIHTYNSTTQSYQEVTANLSHTCMGYIYVALGLNPIKDGIQVTHKYLDTGLLGIQLHQSTVSELRRAPE